MERLISVPPSVLRSTDVPEIDSDLALFYQVTSATPTVRARLMDGTLLVRKGSSQTFAAAQKAGVERVQVWVSAEDLETVRSSIDNLAIVDNEQLASHAYAAIIEQEHLLVFEGSVGDEQVSLLRDLIVQFFALLPTLETRQMDSSTYVLFTANTPIGDPSWLRRWVAALVDARSRGLTIRSYQGLPLPGTRV